MIEALPTNQLVTSILTAGALVAAMAAIWAKALRPFGAWVRDAVRNLRRLGDLLERMIDFLERERDILLARIDAVEQQNVEGKQFHEAIDARMRNVEGAPPAPPTEGP